MAKKKGGNKKDTKAKGPAKKKPGSKLWTLYEVQGDKLVRKNPFSPKSPGNFMAVHKDRTVCGATGYTEFKSSKKEE